MKFYTDNLSACVNLCETSKEDITMVRKDKSELKMSDYYKDLKSNKRDLNNFEKNHLTKLKNIF